MYREVIRTMLLSKVKVTLAGMLLVWLIACDSGPIPQTLVEHSVQKENDDKKIVLRLYSYIGEEGRRLPHEYAMERMKQLMPQVEIKFEQRVDDPTKLKSYAAIGKLPDIFELDPAILESFKQSGNILRLDRYIEEMGIIEQLTETGKDRIFDSDGHIYSMPHDGQNVALLYYNKKLFEQNRVKVPTNYDEFLAAVRLLHAKNIIPVALFAKEAWPSVQFFDMLASRIDPQGLKRVTEGNGTFTEPAFRYAAEKVEELIQNGLISKEAFNTNYNKAYSLFVEGKAAMLLNGTWAMGDLARDMGEDVDYLLYPLADEKTTQAARYHMSGGNGVGGHGVSAYTKYPDIAAKWAILYGLELSKGNVIKAGSVSPLTMSPVQPEIPYAPIQLRYLKEMDRYESYTYFPWNFKNEKFVNALEDNIVELMFGKDSVESFLKDMQEAVRIMKQPEQELK